MTVTTFWLSLGILSLVFLIMLLIFYTLYRREIKVKTESTAKVLGEVVAFDSKNQLLISCLWWSIRSGRKIPKDIYLHLFQRRLLLNQDKPMFSIEPMFLEPAKSGFADDIPNRVSYDSLFIIQSTHRSVLSNDMLA